MKDLLRSLSERGTLVSPEVLQALSSPNAPPKEEVFRALSHLEEWPLVLTPSHLERVGLLSPPSSPPPSPPPKPEEPPKSFAPFDHEIKVLLDITGNSTCEGDLEDFSKYFRDRITKIRKLLRNRREMAGAVPIKSLHTQKAAEVKFVGMVTEIRSTQNGHKLLELEDETGSVTVLAPSSDHVLVEEASMCVEDEVVGVIARPPTRGDLYILQKIVRPEVPTSKEHPRSGRSCAVAFISDIHFGSKTFLDKDWDRFVRWINGELGDSGMRALSEKVKYLVVAGDVVDGVGIFPGQEDELLIDDGLRQYEVAGEEFSRIQRDDLKIVIFPGNHDLVRPQEPQPALPLKYRKTFPSDVLFLGNPCKLLVEGWEIYAYHGFSFVDWITRIPGLSFADPIRAMKEMVLRRHVAPIYGLRTPLAPEHKDLLVLDTIPDIFETGHVHAAGMETFRGIELVNSSCWQSQTSYQKMHGFQPDPGKVPVVELDTGRTHLLDFHGGRAAGVDAAPHGRSTFNDSWKDRTKGGGEWQT